MGESNDGREGRGGESNGGKEQVRDRGGLESNGWSEGAREGEITLEGGRDRAREGGRDSEKESKVEKRMKYSHIM